MKTIKSLLLVGVAVFAMNTVKAQTFGIKAGVNYGSLPGSFSEVKDKNGKAGYNIGVFARVGDKLYVQPEVNFSTFASEYTFYDKQYKPKFNQLNVPIMVGYKLLNTSAINFRVSAGPDINYSLNKAEAPEGFSYKKFNVGAVVNAGVDIGNLTLDLRYSRGLTKINKDLNEKTSLFNLSVGFKIF